MKHEFEPQMEHYPNFDLLKLTPENPVSPIPVLVAPGFGNSASSYALLMKQLYQKGFITISPNYLYDRRGQPRKWVFFPDIDRLKQDAILEAIEREGHPNDKGKKQVNAVGHSKGVYDLAMAAMRQPESFRNFIGVAPGNLIPKMNVVRSLNFLRRGEKRDKEDKLRLIAEGGEVAEHVMANNSDRYKKLSRRFVSESLTSATKSMRDVIPLLRSYGIKIVLVSHTEDSWYAPEIYDPIKGDVDEFVLLPGIHGEIKFRPQVGQAIADILLGLEKIEQ